MELTCCSNEQIQFIVDYSCFAVACGILWHSRLLLPLKLFCTFLHELGHAIAAWLTCNRVTGIEVHADQGGLTHWSTRRPRCSGFFVMPAGYLGSAFWASVLVVSSSDRLASVVAALLLCGVMLLTLLYQVFGKVDRPEMTLPVLLVCLIIVFGGLAALDFFATGWQDSEVPLRMALLWFGVINSFFATWDIITDCIMKDDPNSDAHKFAESIGCCFPRCIGLLWLLLSLSLTCVCVWLTLLFASRGPSGIVRSVDDLHGMTWLAVLVGVGSVVFGGLWNRYLEKRFQKMTTTRSERGTILGVSRA